MAEFILFDAPEALGEQLGRNFDTAEQPSHRYLVANRPDKAEVYAPEADWFLSHTRSNPATQAKILGSIYEARAIRYDRILDENRIREVGSRVALLGEAELTGPLGESLREVFSVVVGPQSDAVKITDSLGAFRITVGDTFAECDQIVLTGNNAMLEKQRGVFVHKSTDATALIESLNANIGTVAYQPGVEYTSEMCQFHDHMGETCAACTTVCPTAAVIKSDSANRLVFSDIDCIACGSCVSVCPTGALESAKMPAAVFEEILPLYEGLVPLVIGAAFLEEADVSLPAGVAPLVVEKTGFLGENNLIALLQESGSQAVVYAPKLSTGTEEAAALLNSIWEKLYNKPAVFIARNPQELEAALAEAAPVAGSRHSTRNAQRSKRRQFTDRLETAVGAGSFGAVASTEHLRYGRIHVDEAGCTLCLSCVTGCTSGALRAVEADGALVGEFSQCTQCGECAVVCPEKVITLENSGIELSASWFGDVTLAKDEPFCCVECGKPFATNKSVMKIVAMLEPLFVTDPIKARTLRCCADCKPKVMLSQYVAGTKSQGKEI